MNGKNTKTFTLKSPKSFFWIFDAYWEDKENPLLVLYTENARTENDSRYEQTVSFGLNKENAEKLRNFLNEKLAEKNI
jgi:hypothetical protein